MNQSKYILEDGVIWPRDEWEDENSDGLRAIELRESEAVADLIDEWVRDASYGDGTSMNLDEYGRERMREDCYNDFISAYLLEIEGALDAEFKRLDQLLARIAARNTAAQ